MILHALHDYYQRKVEGDAKALAPFGFEPKEILFLVVLDEQGNFVDLEDYRVQEGKKLRGRVTVVPQGAKRSGKNSWQVAYLLWDHPGYVLGVAEGDAESLERAAKQHQSFIALIRQTFPDPDVDVGIRAVLQFLETADLATLSQHPNWPELLKTKGNISFRLQGDSNLVCQRPAVRKALTLANANDDEATRMRCLVTGDEDVIERLHPAIKGVWDAQTSGANIVSFNLDAFKSFGKEQGYNAPIGKQAAFAYTSALNHLLRTDSRQRLQVGDASTVFWADRENHPLEESFLDLLLDAGKDNPDRNTDAVRSLYEAPWAGKQANASDDTQFFILGLSPNAARISVRFWHHGPVAEIAGHIRQHFEDLDIERGSRDTPFLSLHRLLVCTALQEKRENIPPNLASDTLRAVLTGTPYPWTLLTAVLRRIRAEHHINYPRAALIKAVLVRKNRHQQEVSVSLDPANPNVGYRLGRLFATLERAQEAASPGLNTTIRERYYGAAAATPVTVFPQLLKLKNHHLAKLENRGYAVNLEKLIGEIFDGIEVFPSHLAIEDQGRFAIGYYHQRQAFYKKSEASKGDKP